MNLWNRMYSRDFIMCENHLLSQCEKFSKAAIFNICDIGIYSDLRIVAHAFYCHYPSTDLA